ncbi:AMP-binding protein [Nocardioides sp. R-C-SC26]|uniref:AMP-binding protein n=1 Tax=Nocardioides sp. R-C-SC26 TaxID=2870414 RepID=UPI001E564EC6|nr:AMP-binding protein [Nocardioides sp. R-C-SC26]
MSELDRVGFRLWAAAEPDLTALVAADDSTLTYGELAAEVHRISHGFTALHGLQPGDTVACVMTNSPGMVQLYLAAMQSGIYLVTVNYHLTPREIAHIIADSGARLVVCSERAEEVVVAAAAAAAAGGTPVDVVVDGSPAHGSRPWTALTEGMPSTSPEHTPAGSLMMYTSGTTGRPKGVKRPLSGVDADTGARSYVWLFAEFGMAREAFGAWLVSAPLYHSANITPAMGALHAGGTMVLMDGWTPEGFLARVERQRITGTSMVPTHFNRLLQLPEDVRAAADVSSLRYVIHGAAPCSRDVKQQIMDWFGPVVYEYYGSTEVGTTIARPQEWLEHPGTVGRAASISTLKILDERGEEVPVGTEGIVYMRQGEDVVEYHNDPGKTAGARRDGLLTVWDVGYVDEDGFLFLTGRASDLILVGGVNVYPAEIEGVLLGHPQVADVGVVRRADPDLGEVPIAHVVLAGDADPDVALDAIRAYAAEHLAAVKCPRDYLVHPALPRDPNGKLYKARLREPQEVS